MHHVSVSLSVPLVPTIVAVTSGLGYWLLPIGDRPRELLRLLFATGALAVLLRV